MVCEQRIRTQSRHIGGKQYRAAPFAHLRCPSRGRSYGNAYATSRPKLHAGLNDGTLREWSLDQVWIGSDGHLRLLDGPAYGTVRESEEQPGAAPDFPSAQLFVKQVATSMLHGQHQLPLSATTFLRRLSEHRFTSAGELAADAELLTQGNPAISRWARLAHLAVCATAVLMVSGILITWIGSRHAWPLDEQLTQDGRLLARTVNELQRHDEWARQSPSPEILRRRTAFEIYIAGPLRETTQHALRSTQKVRALESAEMRARIEEILRRPVPSAPAVAQAEAEAAIQSLLKGHRILESIISASRVRLSLMVLAAIVLMLVGGVASPLIFRGGLLLQSLGFVVVTRGGARPSRLHALARALVGWSPALLFIIVGGAQMAPVPFLGASPVAWETFRLVRSIRWTPAFDPPLIGLGVFALGGLWAFCWPTRGLQDWVARTWLVPR